MSNTNNKDYSLSPFLRNRYFYGKLMTVKDFDTEQNYMNEKRHLLNRMVNGAGLICGLRLDDVEVSVSDGNVKIEFKTGGTALDSWGREIVVPVQDKPRAVYKKEESVKSNLTAADLTAAGESDEPDQYYLYLEYDPLEGELVSSAFENSSCEETCCPNRVIENFEVIASTQAPLPAGTEYPDFPEFPDFDYETAEAAAKLELKEWFRERTAKLCEAPDDGKIFLLALEKGNSSAKPDQDETARCLSFVTNNRAFSELLASHLSDFHNPHNNLDGLEVEGKKVDHYRGYITIEKDNDITLTPDVNNHKITIGETHSARTDNPHNTTAAQVGAPVSVDGVDHPGGDVDLVQEDSITIVPDNTAKTITIGETHSARADNPHSTTAAQVGAIGSVDDVSNPGGNIDLVQENSIIITPNDAANTITIGETHSARTDNPHSATAAQVGALVSVEGIDNPGGGVGVDGTESITIEADNENKRIRIGETHSARTDNPHNATAAQVGAIVSVDGVENPGGNVDLVQGNSITITPDKTAKTVTIGETHSARTDNPHNATAVQVGALVSVDGVGNPGGNVGLEAQNSITIVPDDTANTITIGETHSGRTGNPHQTKHREIAEVLPVDPTDDDTARNKHVSNEDAKRWDEAASLTGIVRIDGVESVGGNVDLLQTNSIVITPDDEANTITIGETHSARRNNPHETTAAQVGALVSVEGVSNPGGDVGLKAQNSIAIIPDDENNTVTIGETHSARLNNPHNTTAAQVGALISVDNVSNPGGNIDLVQANSITITPDNAANTVTIGETHSVRTDNPHKVGMSQLSDFRTNGNLITGLAEPIQDKDAANKMYVDGKTGGTVSSASDILTRTTSHTRQVNASIESTASGDMSQVNASYRSTVSRKYSQVNASFGSSVGGDEYTHVIECSQVNASINSIAINLVSQVNASHTSTASGYKSQVNASSSSTASRQNSQVNASSNSTVSHDYSQVNASLNVETGSTYTVCGGYAAEGAPSSSNRKWELNSQYGDITCTGKLNNPLSDYGEYFENLRNGEIEMGVLVSLEGAKVRPAKKHEDFIGVVSGTAAVRLGDSPFYWHGRYMKDEWGRPVYEEIKDPSWQPKTAPNKKWKPKKGETEADRPMIAVETEKDRPTIRVQKENPHFDTGKEQIPRSERPAEWTLTGLLGQVYVRCDDTVEPGDYIRSKNRGIGTKAEEKTRLRAMNVTKAFDGKYSIVYCLLI